MDLTYLCDGCGRPNHVTGADPQATVACGHCRHVLALVPDAFQAGRLGRCASCGRRELYRRKDFPQRLGIAIVCFAFLLFFVAQSQYWYKTAFAFLIGVTLIDVVLFALVGDVVICYRCGAQHRGLPNTEQYQPFDLSAHERHRQEQSRLESLADQAGRASPANPNS